MTRPIFPLLALSAPLLILIQVEAFGTSRPGPNRNSARHVNGDFENDFTVVPRSQGVEGPSLFQNQVLSVKTRQQAGLSAPITRPVSFTSPRFQCYIEDTDSYGVMYHANYLRAYDRALHSMFMMNDNSLNDVLNACKTMAPDGADVGGFKNKPDDKQCIVDTYADWSIVNVEHQRFHSSPPLGGIFCIHGTLVEQPNNDREVWDLYMRAHEHPESTLFNFARVTIARPGVFIPPDNIVADIAEDQGADVTSTKDMFWLYRDEFDAHYPTHLPLRNALCLFERSRSNFLGGPDCLRRLKEEHNLVFVVTKINDCCKFPASPGNGDVADLRPGNLVHIDSDFDFKRNGMIIECHQTVYADDRPIAQATVCLMTLNSETFKPSSDLPGWLRDVMAGKRVREKDEKVVGYLNPEKDFEPPEDSPQV